MAAENTPTSIITEQPALSPEATVLPPVLVSAEREPAAADHVTLTQPVLERLPAANGSLTEVLRVLPGVQVGDMANLSTKGGEIAAPEVSISGGKTYQNNFRIDGQGTNLIIDPLNTTNPRSITEIPSSSQSLFLNKNLLGEVTLLDHNVSARYGQFAGGVVDAKTRDPGEQVGGELFYRMTNDNWTRFHVQDAEAFNQSGSSSKQPRFEKYEAGGMLDLPLSDQTGLLLAYQKAASTIPLTYFNGHKSESRQQERYFAKVVHHDGAQERFALSLLSTPTSGDYFRTNVKDSDFSLETDAYLLTAEYQRAFGTMALTWQGSYGEHESQRHGPRDFKQWNANLSPSKGWGTLIGSPISTEGGYGELEQRQETLQTGVNATWSPAMNLFGQHRLESGIDYSHVRGDYRRPVTSYYYYYVPLKTDPSAGNLVCGTDTETCIEGEQYLGARVIYLADAASVGLNRYSGYLEDTLTAGRLELRPGVRVDYDDYMQNVTVAQRLRGEWDFFGNHHTRVNVGVNRYYSETLLANKLREAIQPYYLQKRSTSNNLVMPWADAPPPVAVNPKANRYSDLKTPYVDEWAAGFDQLAGGGHLVLDYVHRHGKDQFARELGPKDSDGVRYYQLTNDGRTHHDSWRLGWQRSWSWHDFMVNLTRQKTRSNGESYLDLLEDDSRNINLDYVYYQGRLLARDQLPRADYNQTWIGNLIYTGQLPAGFEFTNVTCYRSGYTVMKDSQDVWSDGTLTYAVYEQKKIPEAWLFDWILTWRHALPRHQSLALTLEVYNVFNRKVQAGSDDTSFELGRQVWAGAEYRF